MIAGVALATEAGRPPSAASRRACACPACVLQLAACDVARCCEATVVEDGPVPASLLRARQGLCEPPC